MATPKVSVAQIKELVKIYTNDIKVYYRNRKVELDNKRTELLAAERLVAKSKIESEIKSKCKNVKINSITWDAYYTCYVEFDLSRNIELVKEIFKSNSDIAKDSKFKFIDETSVVIKVDFDYNNDNSIEYDKYTKLIVDNCTAYKAKMTELDTWTKEAYQTAHTGELPPFNVESVAPEECIV